MTQPATDETPSSGGSSGAGAGAELRTFEVEALVTVNAVDETDARAQVDELLQRAWQTDLGRHHVKSWQFELLDDGLVTEIVDEEQR